MKYRVSALFLLVITIVAFTSCNAKNKNRVIVNIPTAKAEANYIWNTLRDINFFEKHNYQVSLPKGSLIEQLKQKSKSGTLNNEDYKQLEQFVIDSVYNETDYKAGNNKIKNQLPLINKMLNQLNTLSYNWSFKEFDKYTVNLTLYGPGGSFNPSEGSLLLFTTPNGKFKNYQNPANTIIHEIIHIGIEEPIIQKYNVPHTLKEHIVDTFVFLHFKKYLPNYKVQNMGENRTDKYLKTTEDFKRLDEFIQMALKK